MKHETAREHAIHASELLNTIHARDERMANLTPDEHLQLVAGGGIKLHNEQQRFYLELAQAHATVALGLSMTEEDPTPDDAGEERFS